jgi:hypothetical protein
LSGSTAGMTLFQLGYQISPIIFSGGIASLIPGGLLPVVAITQSASFVAGLLSGSTSGLSSLDDFFAHYKPLPGSTRSPLSRWPPTPSSPSRSPSRCS